MEPEPTTHTVADLPEHWRSKVLGPVGGPPLLLVEAAFQSGRGLGHEQCANELEQALAREAAAHEETARELVENLESFGRHDESYWPEHLEADIARVAAALARVERTALKEAADRFLNYATHIATRAEGTDEPPFSLLCEIEADLRRHALELDRMAISPADVKQEQVKG